jgi:hypothetical protein
MYLRHLAERLERAAGHYRAAWVAQAGAVERWEAALAELEAVEMGAHAARALMALNTAADTSTLLQVDLEAPALEGLEQEALKLEAVAQAARSLADALEAQEGGLQ